MIDRWLSIVLRSRTLGISLYSSNFLSAVLYAYGFYALLVLYGLYAL